MLQMSESILLSLCCHHRASTDSTGWNGVFTPYADHWPRPSNLYFTYLIYQNWTAVRAPETGLLQWELTPGQAGVNYTDSGGDLPVFRLPVDIAFRESEVLASWSEFYAGDEAHFVADFQRSFQRMMQMGAGLGKRPCVKASCCPVQLTNS